MSNDQWWGVWGGRAPGGWCHGTAFGPGYTRMAGTKEEAQRVREEFIVENNGYSYEVCQFDSTREPIAVEKLPTPAQFEILEIIHRGEDPYTPPPKKERYWANNRRSIHAVIESGWVMKNVSEDGMDKIPHFILTKAGIAAMTRYIIWNKIP